MMITGTDLPSVPGKPSVPCAARAAEVRRALDLRRTGG
jgi:hypothetical protein